MESGSSSVPADDDAEKKVFGNMKIYLNINKQKKRNHFLAKEEEKLLRL